MNRVLRLSLAAVLVAGLAACGGFSSGLPKNTQLDDLDADQARQFCERAGEYMSDRMDANTAQRVNCYVDGIVAGLTAQASEGDPAAACNEARDECLQEDPDEFETDCSGDQTMDCHATVGEAETCIEDLVGAYNAWLSAINDEMSHSCDPDDYESDLGVFDDIEFEDPESCEAVEESCHDD